MELLCLRPINGEVRPMKIIDPLLWREANEPSTTPERLLALAEHPELQEAIAKNPNISQQLLLRLGYHYPEAALENPSFEMFLLEDPDAFFRRSHAYSTFQKIFSSPNAPVRYLYVAFGCGALYEAIARSTNLPLDLALQLLQVDSSYLREALAKNPVLGRLEEVALLLANDNDARVLLSLAENPNLPGSCFSILLQRGSFQVRGALADKIPMTEEMFDALSNDLYPAVVRGLAKNPGLSAAQLESLSAHIDSEVRENVAANQNTAPEVLERLAKDNVRNVRLAVKNSPAAPDALRTLLRDERPIEVWRGDCLQPILIGDSGELHSLPAL
jgi:hypothetical protein